MSISTPDVAVRDYLSPILNPDEMNPAVDLQIGPVRTSGVTDPSVFCLATGGPAPERGFDGMSSREDLQPVVQVWICSEASDYTNGVALARSVQEALLKATLPGYGACRPQQSEPLYLQMDSSNRHEFMVVVQLWRAR